MSDIGVSVWKINTGYLIQIKRIKELKADFSKQEIYKLPYKTIKLNGKYIIIDKGTKNYYYKLVGFVDFGYLTSEHIYFKNKGEFESDENIKMYISQIMTQLNIRFKLNNIYYIDENKECIKYSPEIAFKDSVMYFIQQDKTINEKSLIPDIVKIISGVIGYGYLTKYYYYHYNTELIKTKEMKKLTSQMKQKDRKITELETKLISLEKSE